MTASQTPTSTPGPRPESSPWNVPNALTAFRIVLVPVFAVVLLGHPHDVGWRIAATLIFAVAIATDFVDGHLARKYDIVTSFGKLADPIADKALTGMAFIGLSVIGELWWWVTIVILVREWGITILRFVIIRYGVMAANRGGKIKTVLQAVALILYLLPLASIDALHWLVWPARVIMAAAFAVTVVSGVDYLVQASRMRRSATRTGA